jgi:hypothetical protein
VRDKAKAALKVFVIAMITEFLSFFIVVVNTRAYTKGLYFWTFATDAFFITQTFFVARWMIEVKGARGLNAYFGFLIGGTAGSLFAIWITKLLYGG